MQYTALPHLLSGLYETETIGSINILMENKDNI